MLNIISLTALRDKVTGPGKVVQNLMKGLDEIGYPYVINHDLNSTKNLWIHDDTFALASLSRIQPDINVIIGPNLFALPRHAPELSRIQKYIHIMPSAWVVDFWKHFGYQGPLDFWSVGIDTEIFLPSTQEKNDILVYYKQRPRADLEYVLTYLKERGLSYTLLEYGQYVESAFLSALSHARYAIWIGCSESQGIAFGEMLSSGVPALVWDIETIGQCDFPGGGFTPEEMSYSPVTSAPYFDERCGIKISDRNSLYEAMDRMEEGYQDFRPRDYIMEHMTLAHQARAFLSLYKEYFPGYVDESTLRNTKKFRYNILIRYAFRLYDSRIGVYIRKFLKK